MRRAVLSALVAGGALVAPRCAMAESWAITLEGGAEADSNVERVETTPGGTTAPIAAPVVRAGGRVEHTRPLAGGTLAVSASSLARLVGDDRTRAEDLMLSTGQARWLGPLGDRPVSAGLALTGADAAAITGGVGARTFRDLGLDALVALLAGDDRLMLTGGVRDFSYKPMHALDWRGPVATARLDTTLWHNAPRTQSLELAVALGFEARTYASTAVIDTCPPHTAPSYACASTTSVTRRDRNQRAGLELTWTGAIAATLAYQLTVADSNSFGWSLVRHRTTASATLELIRGLFATATATLQIDQFASGVLVASDIQHLELTSLEDENRSSLQLRLGRALSPTWSVEVRGAAWHDFAATGGASFRRALVYAGVVFAR
jgi:hypothetical protein